MIDDWTSDLTASLLSANLSPKHFPLMDGFG